MERGYKKTSAWRRVREPPPPVTCRLRRSSCARSASTCFCFWRSRCARCTAAPQERNVHAAVRAVQAAKQRTTARSTVSLRAVAVSSVAGEEVRQGARTSEGWFC